MLVTPATCRVAAVVTMMERATRLENPMLTLSKLTDQLIIIDEIQRAPEIFPVIRVLIDGHSPGPASGTDIDEQGFGTVSEPRMYQLIRQPGMIADRECIIEFLSSGVSVYDFTFG